MKNNISPLINAGFFIGVGMGGFVDGILFHQIFQFHNMLSARYFPDTLVIEQLNMFWDGLFHALTWTMTAAGIFLLWRAVKNNKSPLQSNVFMGSISLGWGLFNLVEGVIDHHILGLHHVVERAVGQIQLLWDLSFLFFGIGLIIFGFWQINKGQKILDQTH